jgi:hypothetical protein
VVGVEEWIEKAPAELRVEDGHALAFWGRV